MGEAELASSFVRRRELDSWGTTVGHQGPVDSIDRNVERMGNDTSPRTRVLAATVEAVAVVLTVGALVSGAKLPPVGVLLALLGVALVCANRDALFSSELAATAEASVVLCAVVAFHADAPLLGPLLIGIASGWLDSYHWSSRAFVRMMFNSGKLALSAAVAAVAFANTTQVMGSPSTAVLAASALVAAVVFVVVDAALLSVLVVVRDGTGWTTAARDVARTDALSLPLALYGGAAGLIAIDVDVWLGIAAVAPAAWVPETFLVPRSMARRAPRVVAVVLIAVGAFAVGLCVGSFDVLTTAFVVGVGVLSGLELAVDRRFPVPPVLAAVLALVIAAVGRPDVAVVCALFAATTAAISWSLTTGAKRGMVLSVAGTVGVSIATGIVSRELGSLAAALAVFVAGVIVVALVASPRTIALVGWSLPLIVISATGTELHGYLEPFTAATVAIAVVVGAAVLIALAGPTPWRGRLTALLAPRAPRVWHRSLWLVMAFATAVCISGGFANSRTQSSTASVWVIAVALIAEVAAAMALQRVRLWRFGRRRRVVELVSLGLLLAVLWIAAVTEGNPSTLTIVAAAAACAVFAIGWRSIEAADRVSGHSTASTESSDRLHDDGPSW